MNKSTSSNVVRLDRLGDSASFPSGRASVLLDKSRDFMVTHLKQALPAMMDKVDDSLFEMADKADTNQQQSLYFEAMREVRLKRAQMEEMFVQQFLVTATKKTQRARDPHSDFSLPELSEMSLVLLDHGDLEESLAVKNMVSKIRTQCGQELFALDKRIAVLLDDPTLQSEDNPIGPETVCESFKEACQQLDATIEVKLIILKLYDKFVISEVKKIYTQLNQLLIQNKVLPAIRTQIKRSQGGRRRRPDANPPQAELIDGPFPSLNAPPAESYGHFTAGLQVAEGGATQQQMFQLLHHLMYGDAVDGGGQTSGVAAANGMLDGLTELQRSHVCAAEQASLSGEDEQTQPGAFNLLRDLKATKIAQGMAPIDDMMIDVVAMMFDYILDDQDIPVTIKALIGRLQIPILKVSIVDKSFFANKSHPARRLLNTLGSAATKWNDKYQRSDILYAKTENAVQRILEEFTDNVDLFTEVLGEFEAYLEQEETQAGETVEQSATDIEIRERLNLGRQKAQQEIEKRLERRNPVAFVRDFLVTQWKELLVLIYVEQSEAGDGWRSALDTMDDLLWSIAPKPIAEDRNRLISILPRLLERMKSAMQLLAMPAEESRSFLGKLAKLHLATVNQEPPAPEATESPTDADEPQQKCAQDAPKTDEPNEQQAIAKELFGSSFKFANDVIYITATERIQCRGMGTTLLAAQFEGDRVTIGHVGDSRLYRLRKDQLEQITGDHSLQQAMIEKGYYTVAQAREKIGSHILARAVGAEDHLRTDLLGHNVQPHDIYLLCSDGLTDMVGDTDIQAILSNCGRKAQELAQELVDLANENGGQDNISVIVARILATNEDADPTERLDLAGITDVGRKRAHNEDNIGFDPEHGLAVLADGMGGCQAGEVASALAMNIVMTALSDGSLAGLKQRASDTQTEETAHEKLGVSLPALWRLFCDDAWVCEATQPAQPNDDDSDELGPLFVGSQGDIEIEEIEIGGPPVKSVVEDKYTTLVRELEVGSWVEFKDVDGKKIPARLSWISPVTSTYLFTDRRGLKVADPSLYGLASEFRRGGVTMAQAVPLFDRAVSSLGAKLRGNTGARQASSA